MRVIEFAFYGLLAAETMACGGESRDGTTGGSASGGGPAGGTRADVSGGRSGTNGSGASASPGGRALSGGSTATSGGARSAGGAIATAGGTWSAGGAIATAGQSGASGGGGRASDGGTATSGGSMATGGASGAGGAMATDAGMPQTCNSMTCNNGFSCCGTECVNLGDDPRNCGHCSTPCSGATPVCLVGKCVETPCFRVPDAGACPTDGYCCGNLCCAKGQICCFVPAILELPRCVDPETSGGTCPKGCPTCVCASPDTPIATPTGVRAIAALRVGDPVLSVDHGRIATVLVAAVHRAEAPHHFVVHVELANGASLDISALHPTADGRTFGDLHAGDLLGGVRIERVRTVPYDASFTYDILPASDSGTYFAGGVLIGSTLGGDALASRGTDYAAMTLDFPGRTKGHD